jgi:alginate O-acetyltransferase complex protein AlgI
MAFSSNFFLFAFLPIVLALQFALPAALRNAMLLLTSLLFYAFDTGYLIWLLIVSILVNHFLALWMVRSPRHRYHLLVIGIVTNLGFLFHYKYTVFIWTTVTSLFALMGVSLGHPPSIALPIGISFFTFQAISYLADVYTGLIKPAKRVTDFGAYHSLFPQLIAGPIVRYVEIESDLYRRQNSLTNLADGIFRFCLGLGKKLIIADQVGPIADRVFALPPNELSAAVAWTGILCYTLQIYFDFSGYSDMAIGLGRMLGFHFPENFNQPYRSRSITEFWRRWHITLSRWFRDYVYIPAGGNRGGPWRTYRNLFLVFILCGLWHGAGYTFVVWGLYQGAFLATERVYIHRRGRLPDGPLAWAITFIIVMIGWVFFRSATMGQAFHMLSTMFGLSQPAAVYYKLSSYLTLHTATFMLSGLFFALFPFERFSMSMGDSAPQACWRATAALAIFAYSVILLSAHSFNPFIYFRF